MKPCAVVLALAACGARPAAPLSNAADTASGQLVITADAIGPVTAATPVSLAALRTKLGALGYQVTTVNHGGVEYHVALGNELVFYIIPDDAGGVFNVHATSPRVAIASHPEWRIGAPLISADPLTFCDCWGDRPVCFKTGEPVALAFDRTCGGLGDPRARRALIGLPIQRAVWSPKPFAAEPALGGPDL